MACSPTVKLAASGAAGYEWVMFSRRTPDLLSPNAIAEAMEGQDSAVGLDLTVSNPTAVGLVYPEKEILAALSSPGALRYEPDARGLPAARKTLHDHLSHKGLTLDPGGIFLSASTSEAYSWIFKLLCDPGDEVLVPEPSYPLLEHLLRLESVERHSYRLAFRDYCWRIDFNSLEASLSKKSKAIVVVQPNNPTGNYLLKEDREKLVTLAAERQMTLVSDEVFFDYPANVLPEGAASLVGEKRTLTFVLGGLSKTLGLPQLKLGWLLASGPAEILAEALERLELVADTYLSVGTPVQHALPALLALEGQIQGEIRRRLKENRRFIEQTLADNGRLRVVPAEGGWYAVIELVEDVDEEIFVLALLEEDGVAVQPGYFFDFSGKPCIVVSLLPEPAIFSEGVRKIAARVER